MSSLWRVRFVLVLPSGQLGGAERQALVLARYLRAEEGADVRVWGLGSGGTALDTLCQAAGLEWRALPIPPAGARGTQVAALLGFVHALRRTKADVLLPFSRLPNRLCGLFWQWTGARLCVWNHRTGAIDAVPRRVDIWAARRTPVFVANSRHGAEYLAKAYGLTDGAVHVIPNGVELAPPERSRVEWRRHLGVGESAFLACMVANLTRYKDHATLLRAWKTAVARLGQENREAVLLLAGERGETYESLRTLSNEFGLGERVRFLGSVADVSGLLQAVDLGVFASPMEGSPNAVLECMAAGLPVVGSDIPGVREAVGSDGLAYLAPVGDADRFADLMLVFARDAERRARAGEANRRRIEQCFSPRQMGARMAALCAARLSRVA